MLLTVELERTAHWGRLEWAFPFWDEWGTKCEWVSASVSVCVFCGGVGRGLDSGSGLVWMKGCKRNKSCVKLPLSRLSLNVLIRSNPIKTIKRRSTRSSLWMDRSDPTLWSDTFCSLEKKKIKKKWSHKIWDDSSQSTLEKSESKR